MIRYAVTAALATAIAYCAVGASAAGAAVIDFEGLLASPDSFYNGSDGAGGFTTQGAFFNNTFTDFGGGFTAWSGWSLSNKTDTATPGFGNQYSAFSGGGAGGSSTYGVAFDSFAARPTIDLSLGLHAVSMQATNTTFAALSMLTGDAFAKKFGGPTGDDPDWLKLTITGVDASDRAVGTPVEFYLADYRFADNSFDFVVDQWREIDLLPLEGARKLSFGLDSTDVGDFGINTPTYFAVDDLVLAPEPSSVVLLAGMAIMCAAAAVRRRRRNAT